MRDTTVTSKRKIDAASRLFFGTMFVFALSIVLSFDMRAWAAGGIPAAVAAQVYEAVYHDVSPPLRDILPLPPSAGFHEMPLLPIPHIPAVSATDPVLQTSAGPAAATTLPAGFAGLGYGFPGFTVQYIPPDTNGAAGETQFVQWVNASFAVFGKTGTVLYGPAAGNTLWSGFGSQCQNNNSGDPIAQFDKVAGRWVMMQPVFKSPYYLCVAVSTTADATGTYYRYAFAVANFPDYPKLGVWADGYYVSFNQFKGNSFLGAEVCVLDRASMLHGNAASIQCFSPGNSFASLLPSDMDGLLLPPSGSPGYYLNFGSSSLNLWQLHVDFVTPANSTFSGPTSIPVAAFSEACGGGTCIPQVGTSQLLDSLGDRLMYRLAYQNFGTYESLVVNHSVNTGSGNTGVRWYEIRSPGSAPTVYQEGTYAPDVDFRWMGSIAQDNTGNMAAGYSVSSSAMNPAIRYTGRVPSDPLGTLEAEQTIISGTGSQTNYSRWGDYSSMAIDPMDGCTFWYTNEYLENTGYHWSTWIAFFNFPSTCPGTAFAIAGATDLSGGGSLSGVTLTLGGAASGTVTSYAGGNYSFANLANGTYTVTPSLAGYSFTPTSITVTVNNGNAIGRNFTATPLSGGTYSISGTVTTSGGSALSGVTMVLTGASSGSATTDANGNYTFIGLANGTYTVTPSLTGYTFSPTSATVTVSGGNVGGVNFTGTVTTTGATYSISGNVSLSNGSPLPGVAVTLSGAVSGSVSTNGTGNYSFTGLPNGTYTVTPSKNRYTFSPTSITVTVDYGNATGLNFIGTKH